MPMKQALATTVVLLTTNLFPAASQDLGFAELFTTHNASVDEVCIDFPAASYLEGTFVLPSLGQFEMADETFTGLLDGFGKLARFTLSNQSLCYHSRMMDTGFYNESMHTGKVAPGLMFSETAPPRNYSGLQNIGGPNDNVFVNTYSLGVPGPGEQSHFRCVTDSQMSIEFDPLTLNMIGKKIKWEDKMDFGNLPIGSAHPLPHPHEAGCIINVHPQTAIYMLGHKVSVYKMCNDAPFSRKLIHAIKTPYMPYYHSWGLTASTIVLPMMHFTLNFIDVMKGQTLSKSFKDIQGNDTTIHLMPIDGSAPTSVALVGMALYYTHVVNAYDDVDAVTGHRIHVMDVIKFSNNPFNGDMADLAMYRNKTARDALDPKGGALGIPTRIVIDAVNMTATAAALKGFDAAQKDPMAMMETDFPKINPNFSAQKYCLFWAVQWRTNYPKEISYAQMGIIKYNVCTNEYLVWKKDNSYPRYVCTLEEGGGGFVVSWAMTDFYLFYFLYHPFVFFILFLVNRLLYPTTSQMPRRTMACWYFPC